MSQDTRFPFLFKLKSSAKPPVTLLCLNTFCFLSRCRLLLPLFCLSRSSRWLLFPSFRRARAGQSEGWSWLNIPFRFSYLCTFDNSFVPAITACRIVFTLDLFPSFLPPLFRDGHRVFGVPSILLPFRIFLTSNSDFRFRFPVLGPFLFPHPRTPCSPFLLCLAPHGCLQKQVPPVPPPGHDILIDRSTVDSSFPIILLLLGYHLRPIPPHRPRCLPVVA